LQQSDSASRGSFLQLVSTVCRLAWDRSAIDILFCWGMVSLPGFDCQSCDHFPPILRASKNPTFLWAMIWSVFLATGHCSLFALWLPLQFRHF
jgi:hypothetical protein